MNQNNQKKINNPKSEKEMDFYVPVGAILVEVEDRSVDLTRAGSKEFTIVQFTPALLGRKED
ncbi:hypothetical protein [Nitrososphaera sp. AFS]|uniref:hypothetical protein n=1 Tax=Nitrososphaera sp. AFS TaxID=2301191 RepID=UPI00139224E1|nr:hypothetical protein [Nitrososphaera sp. AFS]NAL78153.1 hypothetical protein [Nitrososphaera sp. AFS]